MTESTNSRILKAAEDLAGAFYDQNHRSPAFRREIRRRGFTTAQGERWYIKNYRQQFVDAVIRKLCRELADPNTDPKVKDGIYDMIVEHNTAATHPLAESVLQANLERTERDPWLH